MCRTPFWLTIAVFTAAFASFSAAQNGQDAAILARGTVVERELSGGQEHEYRLALAAGEYAKVIVEQRGIDVVVQVPRSGRQVARRF